MTNMDHRTKKRGSDKKNNDALDAVHDRLLRAMEKTASCSHGHIELHQRTIDTNRAQ